MDERGGDINQKYSHRFSKLLSDKLELKEVNNSVGGYSNHRIFRTAYDWIINQSPQTIKETLFIIGITDVARTDLQLNDGEFKLGSTPSDMDNIHNDEKEHISRITKIRGLDIDYFFDLWKNWFKYVYSEDIRLEETIRDYHLLQNLIKSLGGDVMFLNTVRDNARNLSSEVHLDSRLQWFKPLGKHDGWREFIEAYDSDYGGEHPNTNDHEILSQELYRHIIKNYE